MRLHTGSKPYGCPECPQRFRTPSQRIKHFSVVHQKSYPASRKRSAQFANRAGPENSGEQEAGPTPGSVESGELWRRELPYSFLLERECSAATPQEYHLNIRMIFSHLSSRRSARIPDACCLHLRRGLYRHHAAR